MSNKNNPAKGSDPKTTQLQGQIDEVTGIMQGNVAKLLKNVDDLTVVEAKSNDLREHSEQFKDGASKIKRAMWWKNVKTTIIIGAIVLVVIGAIVLVIALSI
mmetsp:Transcript_28845/g.40618  ORF Transcript_28845/g.40618 Transcript_28845/m.40618 type:complete len:102 (+) Transcript_28845:48-353(+)